MSDATSLPDMERSEERREFRAMLRRFFEEASPLSEARRVMESGDGTGVDNDLWKRSCEELGLPGIAIAEKHGGQGFGPGELAVALGECGRALAPVPLLPSALAATAIARVAEAADAKNSGEWLGAIARGRVATLAGAEDAGASLSRITTTFKEAASGDGTVHLTGEKPFVVAGLAAETIFVVARAAGSECLDGLGLFAVEADAPGLSRHARESLDPTRPITRLVLDRVPAVPIGSPGNDGGALARAQSEATALFCCEIVGSMERVLETAVDYAKERHQFGRAIGSFQAIKHKCADMLIAFEGARSATAAAISAIEDDMPDAATLASVAKAMCGPAFEQLATENVQIHGGVGYTWEYDAHLWYRRAYAAQVLLGSASEHRERLAQLLAHADADALAAPRRQEDAPADAAFRADARSWLEEHAPEREGGPRARAAGEDEEAHHFERSREWQRTLFEGGWAALTWPEEFGGRGATPAQAMIFREEAAKFDRSSAFLEAAIGLIGPSLMRFGTPAQQERYLKPMLRADEVWCQLFSEPEAGSDLAAVRTRAVRDGDEFVVNGQKVWTTSAQYADWGFLLARTNLDVPKHRGISFLLIDMRQPGVEVRPLVTMRGDRHFNEVFFNDARVPVENVVNGIDDGWAVAKFVLMNEGANIGTSSAFRTSAQGLARHAVSTGRFEDAALRQRLGEAFVEERVLELLQDRLRGAVLDGRMPDVDGSVLKILWSEGSFRKSRIALEVQGPQALLAGAEALDDGFWQDWLLARSQATVGGGTSEVHRNGLGERALGLPSEPRLDRGAPFRELKTSGS